MPTPRSFFTAPVVDGVVGGVAEGLGPAILPTVEQFTPSGLTVAPLEKYWTTWGHIKKAD